MHNMARKVAVPIDGAFFHNLVNVSVVGHVREQDWEGEHDCDGRKDDDQKLPACQDLGSLIITLATGPQGDAWDGHWQFRIDFDSSTDKI